MSKTTIGHCFPIIRGNWSSNATYNTLNIIYYQNSSYICKGDNVYGTNPIDDTTHWQLLAAGAELSGNLTQDQLNTITASVLAQANLVQDPNYIHTDNNFSNPYKLAIDTLGKGNLTIKQNGKILEVFNANDNSDKSVNISVPTNIYQLDGSNRILSTPELKTWSDTEFVFEIEPLPQNIIFECEKELDKIIITELDCKGSATPEFDAFSLLDTQIIFRPTPNFLSDPASFFILPRYVKFKQPFRLEALDPYLIYRLTISRCVATLDVLSDTFDLKKSKTTPPPTTGNE